MPGRCPRAGSREARICRQSGVDRRVCAPLSGSCRDRARNAHGGVAGGRSGRRVGSASRYRHPQIKDQCPCPPACPPRPPPIALRAPFCRPAAAASPASLPPGPRPPRPRRARPRPSASAPALASPSSHSARPAGSRPRRRICPLLRSSGSPPPIAGLSAAIASGIPRAVRQRAAARRGPSRRPLLHPPPPAVHAARSRCAARAPRRRVYALRRSGSGPVRGKHPCRLQFFYTSVE